MAKTVQTHVAEVKRHEGPICLPQDMKLDAAIDVLQRKKLYDDEVVRIQESIPCFPWDGALALAEALTELFGFAMQEPTWTFFGKQAPRQIQIETAVGITTNVPWGQFTLPGIAGWVATAVDQSQEGRLVFQVVAEIKHADEDRVRGLMRRTREIAMSKSIYRGKAISIRFRDEDGDPIAIPKPTFLAPKNHPVIFSKDLEAAIETNLLTPIRHSEACRMSGIPLKRGALLAGRYGTGKTLSANMVAREAEKHGWTFVYVTKVEELAMALRFAQGFQPAVVFAEDIERSAGINRTDEVNEILNTLDGIGSKSDEIMTILTSNHPENVNPAMRRPGRIDLVLEVMPPDAEAAERLVVHYAGSNLAEGEDLSEVGELLRGQIPAVIREVVERSKLEAICRTGSMAEVTAEDLSRSAHTLAIEQGLFKPAGPKKSSVLEAAEVIGREIAGAIHVMSLEERTT